MASFGSIYNVKVTGDFVKATGYFVSLFSIRSGVFVCEVCRGLRVVCGILWRHL